MNYRMYELINQCFIATTDGELSQLNTVSNIEKFAELIVRECISALDEADGSVHHRECLLDHFGVE